MPYFSKSVRKNAAWITITLLGLYLAFSFVNVYELEILLTENLDDRIEHELEHVNHSFRFEADSIFFINPNEFTESDLVDITDNPFFLQIYDLEGKKLFSSLNLQYYKNIPVILPNFESKYYLEDLNLEYEPVRVGYQKFTDEENAFAGFIQLASPKKRVNEILESVAIINLAILPIIFVLFAGIALVLAKASFRPINRIIDLANKISAQNISERLDYEADPRDELGQLKYTLNNLFDRLEEQIIHMSHFSDNASHQLMTPLTTIKSELEYLQRKNISETDKTESIAILNEQTEQMIKIVRTMLILAKDCDSCADNSKIFSLNRCIESTVKPLFANRKVEYNLIDDLYLRGREEYFGLALQNIIENGLKYSQDQMVLVDVKRESNEISISIIDSGIGIDQTEKENIFEYFYRAKNAEYSDIKGYGMGLSLVKAVITKMGGQINIENNLPKGTKFIITIPVVNLN